MKIFDVKLSVQGSTVNQYIAEYDVVGTTKFFYNLKNISGNGNRQRISKKNQIDILTTEIKDDLRTIEFSFLMFANNQDEVKEKIMRLIKEFAERVNIFTGEITNINMGW